MLIIYISLISEFHIGSLRTVFRCIEMLEHSANNLQSAALSSLTKSSGNILRRAASLNNGPSGRQTSSRSSVCSQDILSKQQKEDLSACYEKLTQAAAAAQEVLRTLNLEVVKVTGSCDTIGGVKRMLPVAPSGNCRKGTRCQSSKMSFASRTSSVTRDVSILDCDEISAATSP